MSRITLQQLLLAGAHFGHLTRRWHPKMKPYILIKKNGIHLLDLRKTQQAIDQACKLITEIIGNGQQVLFIGTKTQARDVLTAEAKRINMPYVTERWLGGMLTNFQTIRQGVKTLIGLEKKMTDGTFEKISKKERLSIERHREKLLKSLGGIRDMRHLPGAVFVVDILRERIAVAEARRLGIPVIAIVDTNVDPETVDYPIPANDDAFKTIAIITRALADAAVQGAASYSARRQAEEEEARRVERDRDHIEIGGGTDKERERPHRRVRRRRPGPSDSPKEGESAAKTEAAKPSEKAVDKSDKKPASSE